MRHFNHSYKTLSMETGKGMQTGGKGSSQHTPKSSLPQGNVNDTGVKNGIGVPDTSGNTNKTAKQQTGNDNKNRYFSNERHIF